MRPTRLSAQAMASGGNLVAEGEAQDQARCNTHKQVFALIIFHPARAARRRVQAVRAIVDLAILVLVVAREAIAATPVAVAKSPAWPAAPPSAAA